MSQTQSLQNPTTYLINNGSYTNSNISFDLNLPKPQGFSYNYSIEMYNISKSTGSFLGNVNAICFFMKKSIENEIPLSTVAETKKNFSFDPTSLISHNNAIKFESSRGSTYILVIHNHDFDYALVNQCFNELEGYISNVTLNNPRVIDIAFIPRKLGVSIITR